MSARLVPFDFTPQDLRDLSGQIKSQDGVVDPDLVVRLQSLAVSVFIHAYRRKKGVVFINGSGTKKLENNARDLYRGLRDLTAGLSRPISDNRRAPLLKHMPVVDQATNSDFFKKLRKLLLEIVDQTGETPQSKRPGVFLGQYRHSPIRIFLEEGVFPEPFTSVAYAFYLRIRIILQKAGIAKEKIDTWVERMTFIHNGWEWVVDSKRLPIGRQILTACRHIFVEKGREKCSRDGKKYGFPTYDVKRTLFWRWLVHGRLPDIEARDGRDRKLLYDFVQAFLIYGGVPRGKAKALVDNLRIEDEFILSKSA